MAVFSSAEADLQESCVGGGCNLHMLLCVPYVAICVDFCLRLQQVSAIRVELPQRWQQLALGWYFTFNDLPMCRSNGDCFIDPTDQFSIVEYPFRTTLALRSDGWEVIETCKRLVHVVDKRARLGAQGALTILSKEWFDMEECGIQRVVHDLHSHPMFLEGGNSQCHPHRLDLENLVLLTFCLSLSLDQILFLWFQK